MDSDRQWGWYRGIASWHALCGTPPPLTTPDYYHPSFASFRRGVVLLRFSPELIGHPCSILRRMGPDMPPPFRSFGNRFENEHVSSFITRNRGIYSLSHRCIGGNGLFYIGNGGVLRGADGRTREETENGYGGRSKILIHNPFFPTADVARFTIPFRI